MLAWNIHNADTPTNIQCVDRGHTGALALLDLSSDFDTVDQPLLLQIIHLRFCVTDSALSSFQSYLTDRSYVVAANGQLSSVVKSCHGIPQVSVLGPMKFIAYTEDIDAIFQNHGLNHHCFVDDTLMYIATPRTEAHTIAPRLLVSDWCGSRRLQLNAAKTEVIWFGSEFERLLIRPWHSNHHRQWENSTCWSVRDLVVYLNSELNMQAHITKTTQACFLQLRPASEMTYIVSSGVLNSTHSLTPAKTPVADTLSARPWCYC